MCVKWLLVYFFNLTNCLFKARCQSKSSR